MGRFTEEELKCKLKVQFVGEPAVDEGGPRRELFSLTDRMVSSELMVGEEGMKTFSHNMISLQIKSIFYMGNAQQWHCSRVLLDQSVSHQVL